MDLKHTAIGIELGSTRIKAVLLSQEHRPLAGGSFAWENQFANGIWTYSEEAILSGLQGCFASLKADVYRKYGVRLTTCAVMGVSAMMHGYLALDGDGALLCEFRTWRNNNTAEAAEALSRLFGFHIPQRWSVAHLYQAILDQEPHLPKLCSLTTLSGLIHRRLTDEKVLGIGDASGMFPVNCQLRDYEPSYLEKFDALLEKAGYPWRMKELLPKVLPAGTPAGRLTQEGALLLDPSGEFMPGVPMAPPEGDAGTGMAVTNSVRPGTGNVSAGTSIFAMVATERVLSPHEEIDIVATPDGVPVAMVHCNNCCSEIDAWAGLFLDFAKRCGLDLREDQLYHLLFSSALEGSTSGGGLMAFNYLSGEHITGVESGVPLFLRTAPLRLSDFMRTQLMSAVAALRFGLDILMEEGVTIDRLFGHGGFFKTSGAGAAVLSAAAGTPVCVMENAGEGGAYGMALLAAYCLQSGNCSLAEFLETQVFAQADMVEISAADEERAGFLEFFRLYKDLLPVERAAGAICRHAWNTTK